MRLLKVFSLLFLLVGSSLALGKLKGKLPVAWRAGWDPVAALTKGHADTESFALSVLGGALFRTLVRTALGGISTMARSSSAASSPSLENMYQDLYSNGNGNVNGNAGDQWQSAAAMRNPYMQALLQARAAYAAYPGLAAAVAAGAGSVPNPVSRMGTASGPTASGMQSFIPTFPIYYHNMRYGNGLYGPSV